VKLLTLAHFAEIAGERANFKETQKRKKLANTILNGSS
jgi:hypothetical protein